MPKFRCKLTREESVDGKGRVVPGISVAIPLDDMAKTDSICELAISSGDYVPSSPDESKKIARKIKENAYKDMRKKGKIDQSGLEQALNNLK